MIKKIRKVCERTWDWQCSCDTQDILNTGTSQEIWGLVSDHCNKISITIKKKESNWDRRGDIGQIGDIWAKT